MLRLLLIPTVDRACYAMEDENSLPCLAYGDDRLLELELESRHLDAMSTFVWHVQGVPHGTRYPVRRLEQHTPTNRLRTANFLAFAQSRCFWWRGV